MTRAIDRFLRALPQPARENGRGWDAHCPAHEDEHASLSVTTGDDGRVLLRCHAGCEARVIVEAIGLTLSDLFPPREHNDPERIFDYQDENRTLLYQVCRFPGKRFLQRRPDGNGSWIWDTKGVRRVLYRLPELKGHPAVVIAEGERDVETLRAIGLSATCNPGGAGKWRGEYVEQLKAARVERVCVLPDNDPAGEAHARQVARSCHDGGLAVRVLPLPGLDLKGDVSDWLKTHTKADLLEALKACPFFDPSRSTAAGFKLELTSLANLLAEPEEAVDWIVEDRIPAGAIVLLAGKPKAGKSTLARHLAYAIARGERWLGWRVHFGSVWYLVFEDKRSEVRRHFRQLGATGSESLHLFFDQAGLELLPHLHALAVTEKPAAIVVDTLQRLIHVRDMNDYAQVTERCAPLLKLARDTGATLILVHHANKFGQGLDSILGSTALAGSVDNVFILGRSERHRTLSSIQRIGPDLEPIVLALDPATGQVQAVGNKRDADEAEAADRIVEALSEQDLPVTESWIKAHVEGRTQDVARAVRLLLRRGRLVRTGRGGKGDPFKYSVVQYSGSQVPYVHREPGNLIRPVSSSLVPDLFGNPTGETPGNAETGKTATDSGSRLESGNGSEDGPQVPDPGSGDFGVFDSGSRAVRGLPEADDAELV